MAWFEGIVNFACECMFFVGNVLADVAVKVSDFVDKARESIKSQSVPQQDKQRKLHDVNLAIEDLLRKKNRDRRLSPHDQDRLHELKAKREQLKRDIWSDREQETLRTVANNPGSVHTAIVTPKPQHLHIVQYHVGQTVSGKTCRICGKEMMIRLRDDNGKPFWGCVDFFGSGCRGSEDYRQSDQRLFTPTKIPEFQISNEELTKFCSDTNIERGFVRRMKECQNSKAKGYFCPTHGVQLILREKGKFDGALDQFFLGCPFWNYNDKSVSCEYKVMIKTFSQLSAVLKDYKGHGIFS